MNIFRWQPKPKVNVHLASGETVQGFLKGKFSGHYHIEIPTVYTSADTSHTMDSNRVAIPAANVKLLELLS